MTTISVDVSKTALDFCAMIVEKINNMKPEEREALVNQVLEKRTDLNTENFVYDDNEYLKANNNIKEIITTIEPSKINDLMNNPDFQEFKNNYCQYETS